MPVNDSPSKGSELPGVNERSRRGPQWTWLHRIPAIIASLEQIPFPVVDRSVVEELFQLQRRQAHNLMLRFKPCQLGRGRGRTLVLLREQLIAQLRTILLSDAFERMSGQKQKLADALAQEQQRLKHRRVEIRVDPQQRFRGREAWPATLQLSPGRLEIDFTSPNHLAEQLALVALALEDEWETFSASGIAPQSDHQPPPTTTQEATAVADMFRDLELLEEKKRGELDQKSDLNAAKMRTRTGT
jgi:hypothetical protein